MKQAVIQITPQMAIEILEEQIRKDILRKPLGYFINVKPENRKKQINIEYNEATGMFNISFYAEVVMHIDTLMGLCSWSQIEQNIEDAKSFF